MSELLEFDNDQFLQLLTDALRAGPQSPQWKEAVERLRTSKVAGADEYQLLLRAREDLEHGLDYRSIRAGPGFTRKLMDQIDQEDGAASARSSSAAKLVLFIAVLAIIGVVVAIVFLSTRRPAADPDLAVLKLAVFPRTTIS